MVRPHWNYRVSTEKELDGMNAVLREGDEISSGNGTPILCRSFGYNDLCSERNELPTVVIVIMVVM
jgi:hypothetical protein